MSKTFTRRRVARSFLNGRHDRAGAFWTDGTTLYSYSLPLVMLEEGKAVALPGLWEKNSVTTSGHQSTARLAVDNPDYFFGSEKKRQALPD